MNLLRVRDPDDSRIADYRNVPDPDLIARRGLFIAEGRLVVERLLTASRFSPLSLLVTSTALASVSPALERHPDLPVYLVGQEVMNDIAGFNVHRGCLALGARRPLPGWREVVEDTPLVVILERLGNADNVGAIFRHASALGAGAVLLGPACADPLYRKAIRTSMGAALAVPFASAEPWPATLEDMRRDGWAVVALTPSADATLSSVAQALGTRRTAVVTGHEGEGLTVEALAACECHARIPMAPGIDSLNAATAAAIALYELRR